MRIVIVHPGAEVRIETLFGFRVTTYAKLVSGVWVDDYGRRAGPDLNARLDLLGERAIVLGELEQMSREREAKQLGDGGGL